MPCAAAQDYVCSVTQLIQSEGGDVTYADVRLAFQEQIDFQAESPYWLRAAIAPTAQRIIERLPPAAQQKLQLALVAR